MRIDVVAHADMGWPTHAPGWSLHGGSQQRGRRHETELADPPSTSIASESGSEPGLGGMPPPPGRRQSRIDAAGAGPR